MKTFLRWLKGILLPFENPEHPLHYSYEYDKEQLDFELNLFRKLFGDPIYKALYLNMPNTIQGPRIPNTIPAKNSKYYGHWNNPEMKPAREAAREAARAAEYYARHTHY